MKFNCNQPTPAVCLGGGGGGGGKVVLSNISYMDMGHCEGYGFQAV